MTELDGIGQAVAAANPSRAQLATAASDFAVPAFATPPTTVAAVTIGFWSSSTISATAALTGLLALQEAEAEAPRDRDARRRGQEILAALGDLQRALLGDGGADDALEHLAGLLGNLPSASDPHLAAIVAAIRLRASVEVARRRGEFRMASITRPRGLS